MGVFSKLSLDDLDYLFNDRRKGHSYEKPSLGDKTIERVKPPVPKGTCKFCGKKIGTGIFMHEKKCDKRPEVVE